MASRAARWLKRIVIVMLVLASALGSLLWWAAGGRQSAGERADTIAYLDGAKVVSPPPKAEAPAAPPRTLTVMTWNIAYARGTNPDNDANEMPEKAVVERRLREMGALIKARGVDVLLLQEVDFASRRSRYVDQLAALAKHAGLPYMARALSWRSRWVPHPPWPPQKQYGRMLSGGGVLSRFPIAENRVLLHDKPEENGALYNALYLFRYSQFATLQLSAGQQLLVVNNHLEAFKKRNRVKQGKLLAARLATLQSPRPLMLLGGDLNTTPQQARKRTGFADSPEDDYSDDATLPTLQGMAGLKELVETPDYVADERAFFTFPTMAPTRRLDYLFFDARLKLVRREFLRPGKFSDHCPVLAVFELSAGPSSAPSSKPASAPAKASP
jgi:endonuclease/exonuclease/phosphatase family metal-dependent hydrolase